MATSSVDWSQVGAAPAATPSPTPSTPAPKVDWNQVGTDPQLHTAGLPSLPKGPGRTPFQQAYSGSFVGKADSAMGGAIGSGKGKTLGLWDYAMGAGERFVEGGLTAYPKNQFEFWGRFHAAWQAAINHNAGGVEQLHENALKYLVGDERYATLQKNPVDHAVMGLGVEMMLDPISYAGGIGVFEHLNEIGKLSKLTRAARAVANDKEASPLIRWAMHHFANAGEAAFAPARVAKDPEGRIINVKTNNFYAITQPYARAGYTFGHETPQYFEGTQVTKAKGAIEQELNAIRMPILLRHAKGIASATHHDEIDMEMHALQKAEPLLFGDEKMAKGAAAQAKKLGIDFKQYPWFKQMVDLSKAMGGRGLTQHRLVEKYVPNLKNMQHDFSLEFAGDDAADQIAHYKQMVEEQTTGKVAAKRAAAFERPKLLKYSGDPAFPHDPVEAYRARLKIGSSTIAHRWAMREVNRRFGIGGASEAQAVHFPWDDAKVMKWLPEWFLDKDGKFQREKLGDYLRNYNKHLLPIVENFSRNAEGATNNSLRIVANAMTRGITNNSLPHIFNEERAAWFLGGPKALIEGTLRAITNTVPENARLGMLLRGTSTNTFRYLPDEPQSIMDITAHMAHWPGFRQWAWANHEAMRRVDDGLRYVAERNMLKKYPNKSIYEIAHMVDEGLGGYTASPAFIKMLRVIGGMFPLWHLRTVPVTTLKAMMRHPERVQTLLRADENINRDDAFGIKKSDPNVTEHFFGGQAYDTMKMGDAIPEWLNKQTPSYFLSPSAIGQVGSTLAYFGSDNSTLGPLGTAGEMGMEYLGASAGPLGQAGEEAANPYGSKLPLLQRIAYSTMGIYPEYYSQYANRVAMFRGLYHMTKYQAEKLAGKSVRRLQGGLGRL